MHQGIRGEEAVPEVPGIKKKHFWGSGFWNPSYYLDTAKDLKNLLKYINKQKYGSSMKNQTTLFMFVS